MAWNGLTWRRGAALFGLCAALSLAVVWLAADREEAAADRPAVQSKTKPGRNAVPRPKVPAAAPKVATSRAPAPADDFGRGVEVLGVRTNADGSVTERYRTADGKTHSYRRVPPPIFIDPTDNLIAMAISGAESGAAMPPMPIGEDADAEFRTSLEHAIIPSKDDPEDVRELKRKVREARANVKDLMDRGFSFADVMREHRDVVNASVSMHDLCTRELRRLLDEGDAEGAAAYLKKANEKLRQFGYDPVAMPESSAERRARIRAAHGKAN